MALRDDFPESKEEYMGGLSDGWCYENIFAGATMQVAFDMIKTF